MKTPVTHEGYVNLVRELAHHADVAATYWSNSDSPTAHLWRDTAERLQRTASTLAALDRRRSARIKKATGEWPGVALLKKFESMGQN